MDRPNLPVELLCQVLYLLEVDDVLRCGSVNRYFRNLVRESSRLQFTLELAKHRMISLMPPAEFPPFSTRLKLLRDRERNWRSPQHWGEGQKLTLPPTGTVYEFVGGYYANGPGRREQSYFWYLFLPASVLRNLPTRRNPSKTWTHAMGGLKIVDFTFDPPQDLLVLVTLAPPQCESVYQLHLRSFATNEPHPDSSLPMGILPCLPKVTEHQVPLETTGAVRVQVAGDLVALLVKEVHDSVSAHLQIWNWRHGSHYSCAMARMAGIEDFTFLSDDTFLIVRPSGRFECYTFENPSLDGFMYWYICMSSNPAPGQVPRGGEGTGNRVYYPRPDERIHACCLYIFKPTGPGDHHVHSFVFFLNVKMFLNAPPAAPQRRRDIYPLAPYPNSTSASDADTVADEASLDYPPHPYQLFSPHPSFFTPVNLQQQNPFPPPPTPAAISRSRQMHVRSLLVGVQTVPWEAWGPQSTRWFDEALSTDWQHALYWAQDRREQDDADGMGTGKGNTLPTVNDLLNGIGFDVVDEESLGTRERLGPAQRHLRVRDYNPYSLRVENTSSSSADYNGKGKAPANEEEDESRWTRRIVTTPSTTPSRGVFMHDIVSSLPYSEVISKKKFNVTDVMMDDCRVLLMQRGKGGKLKGIDILIM
ncbi:hypothetical protein B0H16DRAFT_1709393 [Mycena metata]|uniref:F-box domain-containing protein n=1 Tax=Mycena metata TaxID=1033252 RepID=A0AAD7P294_9AGAR|nr:hypothetical protein B0H16DRAFT_1709393 [Mycena metata]